MCFKMQKLAPDFLLVHCSGLILARQSIANFKDSRYIRGKHKYSLQLKLNEFQSSVGKEETAKGT